MLHFHKWGKWEDVTHTDLLRGGRVIGYIFIQRRVCVKCGFAQYSEQRIKAEGK